MITMKRSLVTALILVMVCAALSVYAAEKPDGAGSPLPVKVLILPKFEIGDMSGDFPGEAQYYYEEYLRDAEAYDVPHGVPGTKLYYRDGAALCVLGMGKVNAALTTMAVLSDARFDYSQARILSTGCAGSAAETTVMGDVFLITAAVDYDLGHHADGRDLKDPEGTAWFRDADFDDAAVIVLDRELTGKAYALVKDTPVQTTERTRDYMRRAFDGAGWAVRDPLVLTGTTVTADNYWKGPHGHANALLMTETYGCPDPYATTEMEEIAVARAAQRMGVLDRLIVIRGSVNMDVFMHGATPETLWDGADAMTLADEDSVEAADIFAVSMKNTFDVGRIIIDSILSGGL